MCVVENAKHNRQIYISRAHMPMLGLLRRVPAMQARTRLYSTVQPREKPKWRYLLLGSMLKSVVLTLVFGSAVIDAARGRKELEALKTAYEAKFRILEDVTRKIRAREPVDVAQEIRIANAITRHKYNSVTDVEIDEQFEEFLKMAEENTTDSEPSASSTQPPQEAILSSKFL
uniref:Uncharacterized protein n=1 Tax=Candidozyma auris TaxID=498019 RepID=A0A0L0P3N3_CANAR